MTDNEIIKALECCSIKNCIACTLEFIPKCRETIITYAIALINRQKAEAERLDIELKAMRGAANAYKAEGERLAKEKDNLIKAYRECMVEAIKNFAKRIQRHCTSIELNAYIDNLVKERLSEE